MFSGKRSNIENSTFDLDGCGGNADPVEGHAAVRPEVAELDRVQDQPVSITTAPADQAVGSPGPVPPHRRRGVGIHVAKCLNLFSTKKYNYQRHV